MASGDEWEAPMYAMQAAQSSGQAPIRDDYDVSGAVFAVTWMFIGSFFAINLFVGVMCDSLDISFEANIKPNMSRAFIL